jgi:hypothetical protein
VSAKTVIPIDIGKKSSYRESSSRSETNSGAVEEVWTKKQPRNVGRTEMPWDALYPAEEIIDPKIVAAQRLLTDVIKNIEIASRDYNSDPISADDHAQSTLPLLAELFCCRSIGEGFAVIVNAITIGLLNRHGEPLSQKQLHAIMRSLKSLKSHLFLRYDAALRILIELKQVGLNIHPETLQHLDLQHE